MYFEVADLGYCSVLLCSTSYPAVGQPAGFMSFYFGVEFVYLLFVSILVRRLAGLFSASSHATLTNSPSTPVRYIWKRTPLFYQITN